MKMGTSMSDDVRAYQAEQKAEDERERFALFLVL